MDKNEGIYKRKVLQALRGAGAHAQFHEDKYESFIPDLSFGWIGADGWIEVKYLPKTERPAVFYINHYTAGQRDWLVQRAAAGLGKCFLLVGWPGGYGLWLAPNLPPTSKSMGWFEAFRYVTAHCPFAKDPMLDFIQDLRQILVLAPRRRR